MQNEVLKTILARRSVRQYEKRQIDDEQLKAILEAATWAPSGANNQSWLFTAIQNPEVLAKLNEYIRKTLIVWEPDEDYAPKLAIRSKAQKEDYNFFFNAPTFIVASNRSGYSNAMADCAAALENIFLAATSLGLASCWINHLRWLTDDKEVRAYLYKLLNIPLEHVICGAAAIGYSTQTPEGKPRREGCINIIK